MKLQFKMLILTILLAFSIAGCGGDDDDPLSAEKAITAFSIGDYTGTINETAKTITVDTRSSGIAAYVATFTTSGASVTVGTTTQVSGTTPNNFNNPVTYIVTAADGSTASYTVTVTCSAFGGCA